MTIEPFLSQEERIEGVALLQLVTIGTEESLALVKRGELIKKVVTRRSTV